MAFVGRRHTVAAARGSAIVPVAAADVRSVLFICLGNICRSPSAEEIFRVLAAKAGLTVRCDSAGTSNWHIGDLPYGPMIKAALARGYDLQDLRARQVSPADFGEFDMIIGMDGDNIRDIERLRPAADATPVVAVMKFAPHAGVSDVPDPYYTKDFESALDLIETACAGLVAAI